MYLYFLNIHSFLFYLFHFSTCKSNTLPKNIWAFLIWHIYFKKNYLTCRINVQSAYEVLGNLSSTLYIFFWIFNYLSFILFTLVRVNVTLLYQKSILIFLFSLVAYSELFFSSLKIISCGIKLYSPSTLLHHESLYESIHQIKLFYRVK